MKEVALVSRGGAAGSRRSEAASRTLRYRAFLSYSHKDSEVADWLHGALERYRVPRALVGRETPTGTVPANFNPIFRDRHELAASGDLGHTIREALAASRALIVLCSPDAAQSRWTNEEVLAFKKLHPTAPVLAAIIAGEPFASEMPGREAEECFPPALRKVRQPRPANQQACRASGRRLARHRDGRQLGLLKIVAGLLDVGPDDLVRRDQQRRQKRVTYIAAAALAGMTITSGLAVFAFDKRDEASDQRREAEGLVGFMLGDLKDKLEPIGRLDALDAVGARALQYYERQDKTELSDEAPVQGQGLTLMGEIANTSRRPRRRSSATARRWRAPLNRCAASRDPQRLSTTLKMSFVGKISYQRGAMGEPKPLGGNIRDWPSAWRTRSGTMTIALSSYSNNSLGRYWGPRRYGEAAVVYQSSLALQRRGGRRAAQTRLSIQGKQCLACWPRHEYSGALEKALAERERQLRLLQDMLRLDPRDTEIQRYMMTAHRSIGRLLASDGDTRGGLRESLAGVAISDALYRVEPQNTEWLQANAAGRIDLADLQLASGNIAEAARRPVRVRYCRSARSARRQRRRLEIEVRSELPSVARARCLGRGRCGNSRFPGERGAEYGPRLGQADRSGGPFGHCIIGRQRRACRAGTPRGIRVPGQGRASSTPCQHRT